MGQFERRALEAEVVPGGVGQDESKVNVNDVALRVHQNVTVVSVVDICRDRWAGDTNTCGTKSVRNYAQYLPL